MSSRPAMHNTMLVLLTATSGCVDAISFLLLGQVFTAAMTGNTVLFGLALSHLDKLNPLNYASALLGFMLGAAVAAVIFRQTRKGSGWTPNASVVTTVELAALVLFSILSQLPYVLDTHFKQLLVMVLAFAMGLQGVTARRVGVNGVTTTVITSTITGLVEISVWKIGQRFGFTPNAKDSQQPENQISPLALSMWAMVILAYGVGAALCGGLIAMWHLQAVWLPIAIVAVVVVSSTLLMRISSPRRSEQGNWNEA
ncbi:YoaK family protein [Ferroacidibacillus organovorans]|uniref:YoaK family protein n=1 Tax=Ferroacidibacillus organovorans TaxID=1765683 RepID=UPI000AC37E21|nr:YoaK family protein [Ferroacidibacillus organovorans]